MSMKWDDRCGVCKNCRYMEKIRGILLKNCNPPFTHADQDIVDLWNKELTDHPCTSAPTRYVARVTLTRVTGCGADEKHVDVAATPAYATFYSLSEAVNAIYLSTNSIIISQEDYEALNADDGND